MKNKINRSLGYLYKGVLMNVSFRRKVSDFLGIPHGSPVRPLCALDGRNLLRRGGLLGIGRERRLRSRSHQAFLLDRPKSKPSDYFHSSGGNSFCPEFVDFRRLRSAFSAFSLGKPSDDQWSPQENRLRPR